MKIERLSLLWAADRFDAGKPLACIATSYEFNAEFFEQQLLTRFLELRYDEMDDRVRDAMVLQREEKLQTATVAVLVDAAKVSTSASTLLWHQIPVAPRGGLQHAKVTLLVWERHIRVLIGSANLTVSGYQLNREVMQSLDFFDHPGSLPLSLLFDVTRFLTAIVDIASVTPEMKDLLKSRLDKTTEVARKWSKCRLSFGPRDSWRIALVANWPSSEGESGVAAQLDSLWKNRRVRQVQVISPFFSREDAWIESAVEGLRVSGVTKRTALRIMAPAESTSEKGKQIQLHASPNLPSVAARAWHGPVHWHGVRIDVNVKNESQRPLHAKAICIEGDSVALLMTGSSNCTAQGLGLRAPNVEANVAFEFNYASLDSEFEFDYLLGAEAQCEEYDVGEIAWKSEAVASEDEKQQARPPRFFAAAVLVREDQVANLTDAERIWGIQLYFDTDCEAPDQWELLLPTNSDAPAAPLLRSGGALDGGSFWCPLPQGYAPESVRYVVIKWSMGEACLPVLLEDATGYPLAADRMHLTAEQIQAHLIAGRDAARIAEGRQQRDDQRLNMSYDNATNPLRLVTTDGYLLYRARRLGQAISHASTRIADTPATKAAMTFRLIGDPLGPVRLARALVQQLHADLKRGGKDSAVQGCVFGLAEITLMLGYAGERVCTRDAHCIAEVGPVFHETIRTTMSMADSVLSSHEGTGDAIITYLDDCVKQAAVCLVCAPTDLRPQPIAAEVANVL